MTEYVANELRRILEYIPITDPTTTDYHILLQSLECFAGIADTIEAALEQIGDAPVEGKILHVEFRMPEGGPRPVAETKEEVEHPPVDESPFPEESEASEPAQVSQTYTMVEVRAALVEARKRGVNVAALLREFGVENFGAFPAGKYGELMERLKE